MAGTDRNNKLVDKNKHAKLSLFKRIAAYFVRIWKKLKSFTLNLKAELKRVIWPDRKKLIQSTATVIAICLIAAVVLFIVDSILGAVLNGIGFYAPHETTTTTTIAETTVVETTAAGETTINGTTVAGTTTAG